MQTLVKLRRRLKTTNSRPATEQAFFKIYDQPFVPMTSSATTDPFSELASLSDKPVEMIDALVKIYRRQQMPHELFEALKMRTRLRLGLPVLGNDGGETNPEHFDRQLEHGLLDACREVGAMLLRSGRIREGWVYFRPTGATRAAADLIRSLEVTDDGRHTGHERAL